MRVTGGQQGRRADLSSGSECVAAPRNPTRVIRFDLDAKMARRMCLQTGHGAARRRVYRASRTPVPSAFDTVTSAGLKVGRSD